MDKEAEDKMTAAQKELFGNKAIRKAGGGRGEYPAYSEHYLKDRDRARGGFAELDAMPDDADAIWLADASGMGELLHLMYRDLVDMAYACKCSTRQIDCLELFVRELSIRDIADAKSISPSTVVRELREVKDAIGRHPWVGLHEVLAEVFRMRVQVIKDMLR